MPVEAINHINICAPGPLLKTVRDFYVDVLGLVDGERPGMGIKGYWLYAGDAAILHLMEPRGNGADAKQGDSAIDHFALTCTDLPAMEQRLVQAGVEYYKGEYPEQGFAQLFVTDPAGLRVELNFTLSASPD